MPAKRPGAISNTAWRIVSKFLNPESLIAVWEYLNQDDRVLEFFRSLHLPKALSPIARIEAQLSAIEELLDSGLPLVPSTSLMNEWRMTLANLKLALPLVKTAKGKGKRDKVKDLQARVARLQDDIYEHLMAANAPRRVDAMDASDGR